MRHCRRRDAVADRQRAVRAAGSGACSGLALTLRRFSNRVTGSKTLNIAFIGGGNMARALIGGLVARGSASNAFTVVDPSADARSTIAARFGVATFAVIEPPAVAHAEIIVLAIKPQNVRVASRELATLLKRQV